MLRKTRILTRFKVIRQPLSGHLSGPVLPVESCFPVLEARIPVSTRFFAENPGPRSLRSTGEAILTTPGENLHLKGCFSTGEGNSWVILQRAAQRLWRMTQGRNFGNPLISRVFRSWWIFCMFFHSEMDSTHILGLLLGFCQLAPSLQALLGNPGGQAIRDFSTENVSTDFRWKISKFPTLPKITRALLW